MVAGRIAEGQRPAPGCSADESCRKCNFSDEPVGALGPVDRLFGQRGKGSAERELVPDRLGELELLDNLGRRAAAADATALPSSRLAPGAAAVRSQSFGNGSA